MTTLYNQEPKANKNRLKIQYVPVITDKLKKVFKKFDVELIFTTVKLRQLLVSLKDKTAVFDKSGIYQISCNDCEIKYVDQTSCDILTRFNEHMKLKNRIPSAVGEHIMNTHHKISIENLKLLRHVTNARELNAYDHTRAFICTKT